MKKQMFSIISLLFLLSSCNQAGESICLIPKDFTGVVIIIFDQKEGVPPEIENGKHVYRIPQSGILKTQVKANYQVQGQEYYYVDDAGHKTTIPYKFSKGWEDVDTTKIKSSVYCYNEEMGATAKNKPNYKKYRLFLVSKPNQMDSLSNVKNRVLFEALSE
jgi:hypothetical protein